MTICEQFPQGNQIFPLIEEKSKREGIPINGTFELTPRCNFNCKMCYVHLEEKRIPEFGREMTGEEWISIAEQARDMGLLTLCITGGEPLLHPEFDKIYRALSEMGFFITLQTNGSVLTPEILKLLEKYPPRQVKITLYGSNDEVYKNVCGVEKGFTRVDHTLQMLQKMGIPVLLVSTIIKQNLDDVERMAQYSWERRIPWFPTSTVHASIRGADTDAEAVSVDEEDATDFRAEIRDMVDHPAIREGSKPCDYCRGYRNSFWVTWNGNLQFCSFMNEPDISIRGRNFSEAWSELLDFEEALEWPVECQTCEIRHYCHRCAGSLAAQSGRSDKTDPEFCEKMKRYIGEELERRKGL